MGLGNKETSKLEEVHSSWFLVENKEQRTTNQEQGTPNTQI